MSMLYTEFNLDDAIAVAREEGKEDGLEQGLEQGRYEANLAIARNLLVKGSTPEFVSDITGLDSETISGLRN